MRASEPRITVMRLGSRRSKLTTLSAVIVAAFAVIIVRGRVNVIAVVSVGVSAVVATVSAAGIPLVMTVRVTAIVGTVDDTVSVVGVMLLLLLLLIVVVALPAKLLFRLPPSRGLHDRWR